jgi:transcriptional regulator with GAF, ATPase, and Fis domain
LAARSDREAVQTWWSKCSTAAGAADGVEVEVLAKTGAPLKIVWSSAPVRSAEIGIREFILTGEDVTRIHTLEAERDEALEKLRQIKARMETENLCLDEAQPSCITSARIIGQSDAIQYVLKKIHQVAPTGATVLIEGETGVGKELVARALHEASARAGGPFIPVNCAALAPTLIESELFGHEKGAFTGADRQRKGRFEAAEGGTLFLDEVGELPLDMQVKLLRVLQEEEFERVGSSMTRQANVRIIAATNRNLKDEIKSGRFREDLFYRLQVYPISVPALRQRREDIPLLVAHFATQLAAKYGKRVDHIPGYLVADLKEREWPGNVRELMNVVERAVIMTAGHTLAAPPETTPRIDVRLSFQLAGGLMSLANNERAHILKVLEHTSGKIAGRGGAAEILEMHPNTLRTRMDKLGILKREEGRQSSVA